MLDTEETESVLQVGESELSILIKTEVLCESSSEDNPTSEQLLSSCNNLATENNLHACVKCDKQFSLLDSLKKHMKTHTVQQNVCKICSKSFSSAAYIKIHMRVHSGEKPFICTKCGKSFRQHQHMKDHMIIHLRQPAERTFTCSDCGNTFCNYSKLKKHVEQHAIENTSTCNLFEKSFRSESDTSIHKITYHPETLLCIAKCEQPVLLKCDSDNGKTMRIFTWHCSVSHCV